MNRRAEPPEGQGRADRGRAPACRLAPNGRPYSSTYCSTTSSAGSGPPGGAACSAACHSASVRSTTACRSAASRSGSGPGVRGKPLGVRVFHRLDDCRNVRVRPGNLLREPVGPRVEHDVRRVALLFHPVHDRPPTGTPPQHHPAAQPPVTAARYGHPGDTGQHDHPADHLDVQPRRVALHSEGENRAKRYQEQSGGGPHGRPFLFVGTCRPPVSVARCLAPGRACAPAGS